jgi:NAD(P)-dependent dehydrogenase (short-subunit alcohol dehydrogenase family)
LDEKRTVVVTGGGSGIGRAIARRFAETGDTVYVLGRRPANLDETASGFATIIPVTTDITDLEAVEAARSRIVGGSGAIDVLVNCAGGSARIEEGLPLVEAVQTWNRLITLNLTGTFIMTYALKQHIRRPGGRVINMTSSAAFAGSGRGGEAYAAAKSGVHGLSRTLVHQLSPQGITVNCVAPGLVEGTEFFAPAAAEDLIERVIATTPAGRSGRPEDVAAAVFYLASNEASYVTGQILHVNGGKQFSR